MNAENEKPFIEYLSAVDDLLDVVADPGAQGLAFVQRSRVADVDPERDHGRLVILDDGHGAAVVEDLGRDRGLPGDRPRGRSGVEGAG